MYDSAIEETTDNIILVEEQMIQSSVCEILQVFTT